MENVRKQVYRLLEKDNSGHGIHHIDSVYRLSMKFAEAEKADKDIVALIALLHDVDDYKLFGMENAEHLTNAKNILDQCAIADPDKEQVLSAIKTIGYSKRLKGIQPITIEGRIVSDADMCDSMGITGILRSYQYNLAHGKVFFDPQVYPDLSLSAAEYMAKKDGTVVTHMFEKLLRLKDFMLTESGKKEAKERHHSMVTFLYRFFTEENALEWIAYLDHYLNETKESR